MKRYRNLLSLSLLLLLLPLSVVPPLLVIGGCKTPSAQRTSYNTLATVEASTLAAYSAYLDLVIAGKVPTNDVPRVTKNFNSFQQLMTSAITLAQFNVTNAAPPDVIAASQGVLGSIASAKGGAR